MNCSCSYLWFVSAGLLTQCLQQPLRDHSAMVERHGVVQVILQDAEMRWMLRDEHLR